MEISPKPRRTGRLGRVLVNVLSGSLLLLTMGFLAPPALGLDRYVITGSSMTGTIDLGSVVFSEVVPVADLEVGDIITYMPPPESGINHLVTHRIVAIDGESFVTKGDAIAQPDPWTFQLTQPEQARVKYTVPYVGWLFLALQDRNLRMLLIGLPAAIVALVSLVRLLGALRRRPVAVVASATVPAASGRVGADDHRVPVMVGS